MDIGKDAQFVPVRKADIRKARLSGAQIDTDIIGVSFANSEKLNSLP